MKKLAFNIKNDTKNFYEYVRSKQKIQDKVGSVHNNRGILNGRKNIMSILVRPVFARKL